MITKQIAATLYGNSYMLQDKEGKICDILKVNESAFGIYKPNSKTIICNFSQIGTDYHILARPLSDLTKEITHKGETFVPMEFFNSKGMFIKEYFERIIDGKHKLFVSYANKERDALNDFESDKLREWNFAIGLPEGSWIPVTENKNPYK